MRVDQVMKRVRKAKGYTQAALARKLGFSSSYIWQIENRYTRPTKISAANLIAKLKTIH